jgi:hypothetical protein
MVSNLNSGWFIPGYRVFSRLPICAAYNGAFHAHGDLPGAQTLSLLDAAQTVTIPSSGYAELPGLTLPAAMQPTGSGNSTGTRSVRRLWPAMSNTC